MDQRYPDKSLTTRIKKSFAEAEHKWWSGTEPDETIRIGQIGTIAELEIEMSEANGRWHLAKAVVEGEQSSLMGVSQARRELIRADHRYWTALERLKQVAAMEDRDRRHERAFNKWVIGIGALIVSILGLLVAIWGSPFRDTNDVKSNKSLQPTRPAQPNEQQDPSGSGPRG